MIQDMAKTLRPFRQVMAADEEWVSIIRDMLALKEKALNISFFSKTGYDFGFVYTMQGIISVLVKLFKCSSQIILKKEVSDGFSTV